ncbi:MAG: hypothetical protein WCI05_15595 [Myxococcales bacterium]
MTDGVRGPLGHVVEHHDVIRLRRRRGLTVAVLRPEIGRRGLPKVDGVAIAQTWDSPGSPSVVALPQEAPHVFDALVREAVFGTKTQVPSCAALRGSAFCSAYEGGTVGAFVAPFTLTLLGAQIGTGVRSVAEDGDVAVGPKGGAARGGSSHT